MNFFGPKHWTFACDASNGACWRDYEFFAHDSGASTFVIVSVFLEFGFKLRHRPIGIFSSEGLGSNSTK
jgi:hypothetical protein